MEWAKDSSPNPPTAAVFEGGRAKNQAATRSWKTGLSSRKVELKMAVKTLASDSALLTALGSAVT